MNKVTTTERPAEQLPAVESQSANLLQQIIAAATNPEVDAQKMIAMANLATSLQDREHQQIFARDFAAAIMEMPRISKRNEIVIPGKDGKPGRVQGKFASFENIDAVVRPILARHNLVLTFKIGSDQGVSVTPILTHQLTGYERVGDAMRVPPDTSGSKNAAQAVGSSAQYGKRYAMCAMLNIVTEGDDRDGTSYPLADDEMNDRQIRLVAEARASHKDGNFAVWWDKQLPRDREWLILKGVYAELTGAPQIAGPRTLTDIEPDTGTDNSGGETGDSSRPEPEPEPDTGTDTGGGGKRTAAQMVDDYVAKIKACTTTDAVLEITEDRKTLEWLRKLHDKDQAQYDRASTAASAHYSYLMAKEDSAKRQGDLLPE